MGLVFAPVIFFVTLKFAAGKFNLWPLPQQYTNGSDTVTICSSNFSYKSNIQSSILNNAILQFSQYLSAPPAILKTQTVTNIIPTNEAHICSGIINISSTDESLSLNTNESYSLFIETSSITISAQTIYGAMYALTTLKQLIRYDPTTTTSNIISNIPWQIFDYPTYQHRGVMLDSSRNFLSVNTIKTVLDGMALNKLNVFHWHIIDAQSFPFYSKSHPELSQYGAYSPDEIYYEDNITDIIQHAARLGIRVIPEFDAPGHTMIIAFSNPEIMECFDVSDNYPVMCPEPPCGFLNVNDKLSYLTMLEVYSDAYEIFTDSYFHIGADEVNPECWGPNTTEMYKDWIETVSADVHNTGHKTPILWSDHVNVEADIGQNNFDIIIQVWDSSDRKIKALENGFKVIDSIHTSYYLDCGFGSWLMGSDYSWCDPYKNWITIYNHSLTDDISDEYISNIYGGEVCLWGESVDDNNLLTRLWPRAAAAAERWWKNDGLSVDDLNGINEVFDRLAMQRDWMVKNGISASPLHPQFCTLYPEYCTFYRNSIWEHVEEPSTTMTTTDMVVTDGGNECKNQNGNGGFSSVEAIIMFFIGMVSGFVIIGVVYMVLKWKSAKKSPDSWKEITDKQL